MTNLAELAELEAIQIWDGVVGRRVQGDRLTVAVVELAPNAVVPEHRHPHEQCGLVVQGEVTFRIADEQRRFGPGGTWRILGDTPHECIAGPDGAILIDTFTPIRDDWADRAVLGTAEHPAQPLWPPRT